MHELNGFPVIRISYVSSALVQKSGKNVVCTIARLNILRKSNPFDTRYLMQIHGISSVRELFLKHWEIPYQ